MKTSHLKVVGYLGFGATITLLTTVGTDAISTTYGNSVDSVSEALGSILLGTLGLTTLGYVSVKSGKFLDSLINKIQKHAAK